jgi:hypothetical protein
MHTDFMPVILSQVTVKKKKKKKKKSLIKIECKYIIYYPWQRKFILYQLFLYL